jgi:hypothetical protein
MEVHRELGPGLFENISTSASSTSCTSRGVAVATQVPLPLMYDGAIGSVASIAPTSSLRISCWSN